MSLPTIQIVPFVFQDPAGNPLANGYVLFRLSVDLSAAQGMAPQVAAGRTVRLNLDINGAGNVELWPNAQMFPAGSVYFATAYTATGEPVWNQEIIVSQTDYLLQENGFLFLLEGSTTDAILLET
jgi:hypothetical protein